MKTIRLTRGLVALVSDCDYARVRKFKWFPSGKPNRLYAVANRPMKNGVKPKPSMYLLHRFIKNFPTGRDVDHRNRNTLDCRRSNLRIASRSGNLANQIRNPGALKGITQLPSGSWCAQITVNYKRIYIGGFKTKEDAAKAYDKAAIKHFKTFARTNGQ